MRIGKVTESVLKRSVLKIIKSDSNKESAAAKSDCAYSIDENGQKTLSSVAVFTVNSADAGYYAVHNAANNIFCMGGIPTMAVISILLPETAEEAELKKIMKSAVRAANDLNIAIDGGHTEVSLAVNKVVITVTVVGKEVFPIKEGVLSKDIACDNKKIPSTRVRKDFDIVMTKWTGLEGTAILAEICREKLAERLPDYMLRQAEEFKERISVKNDSQLAIEAGACYLHDVSMGGIFAALWEIAQRAGCGLEVDLKKIPIKQETIEITNYLGINPYQLVSGGSLLMLTADGEAMVRVLEKEGIAASIIGITTDKNDRIIKNDDEIRYLDKPQADEICRV
ncbi:AIR synthase related protein [Butyrivibrio sp. JL13D10]|uniref:AIR synthase related protein n=1 Tax=Butyrivibrio sp. JL13D10 TaxID=3236815 RepID=UPI0038B4E46C